ncbi:LacI family DNA-binding transcriptional regulator [Jeotgalibacillus campisalis]|uniref:HTH lacI-type domain-containing protein n=1 Tax=Jeotgalibacillus campisalis TaxID=220754 RepID=A0A0C2SG44_9BACL|nr:LacI family DNA-binding transcriptional regulator [Jeotgalibacillus campisalis]KIL52909.1 hypothetical protein KR50_02380 [Jeotgalibacillus campisalis]
MPTLKDVARKANVSVSTVSYSVNDNPLIPEETRNRVKMIANDMGYRPNGNAKNLKKQKTNIIGLFLSGFSGPFFTDMMEGIHDVVLEKGFELVVSSSVEQHRLLVERYVDGAIILNYHMENELLTKVANEKFPLVVMDRMIEHPNITPVLLPNEEGALLGTKHLLEKGASSLAFIAGSKDSFDGERRLQGFKQGLSAYNLSFCEKEQLIRADFTEESGYIAMTEYLSQSSEVPEGFVAANDEMAIGTIRALSEAGIKVPDDAAVVGFDDIQLAKYIQPALTTVHVPRKEWGVQAARKLFGMLENQGEEVSHVINLKLVSRDSG